MEIFSKYAPAYWAKGLPVIPLRVMEKRPFFNDWSKWSTSMPSQEEQDEWLAKYRPNNMGLPLGVQSGIAVVDYDYDNPEVEKAMMRVLPHSPWHRIGAKGKVMAFKFNNTPARKIFDSEGRMVVEILATGNQVVLPPSIHPDTLQPYTANVELLDVLDSLALLPHDIEDRLYAEISKIIELRPKGAAGGKFKSVEFVPAGARDVQMNRHAGFLAHCVLRGEVSVLVALEDMRAWFDSKVQTKEGDNLNVEKGQSQIIQYVLEDVNSKDRMLPPGWDEGLTDEMKERWGLAFDEDQEEWPFEKMISHIQTVYDHHANNSVGRMSCIQMILTKMSKSTQLDSIQQDKVLHALKADSGLPIASFKRQMKELQRKGEIEGISHTEIAQQVIKELNKKYSSTNG